MAAVLGGSERWLAFPVNRGGRWCVVLWDWVAEKTVELRLPDAALEVLMVHCVRGEPDGRGAEQPLLLAVSEDGALYKWEHGVGGPGRAQRLGAALDLALAGLELRLKLCDAGLDVAGIALEEDEGLVDACRVSAWFSVGVTASKVCWLRDGGVMFSSDGWHGGQRRRDPASGEYEALVAVAANNVAVVVASDFGNLFVLEKKTLVLQRTVPLGLPVRALAMPRMGEPLLAVATEDGLLRVLDLADLQFVEYVDAGPPAAAEGAAAAAPASAPAVGSPFGTSAWRECNACGRPRGACESVASRAHWACRDRATGRTMARDRATGRSWTLVAGSPGPPDLALVQGGFLVCAADRADELQAFYLASDGRCARARRFKLPGPCLAFDIDVQRHNRVVTITEGGQLCIFKFKGASGSESEPSQVILFEDSDGAKPRLVAAHAGRIAVADDRGRLAVLLRHGQGAEQREDHDLGVDISALAWHGPYCVEVNGGAIVVDVRPPDDDDPL
jgi:hypothetical protein